MMEVTVEEQKQLAHLGSLERLAKRAPTALSDDGWRRLKDAGSLMAKTGVSYPDTFLEDLGLRHPSGYLVSGPGSADVIRSAIRGGDGSSAVFAAIAMYRRFYNQPPLALFRGSHGDPERAEQVEKDAVLDRLREPHSDLTLTDLRGLIVRCKLVDGNAYLMKLRSGGGTVLDNIKGEVLELHPVDPTRLRPARDKGSSALIDYYALDLGTGYTARVPKENVIHFREELDHRDPSKGIGAVKQVAREVATDAEADVIIQAIMRNMGFPGLVFAPKEQSKGAPIDVEQLQSYIQASTTGENRGKPLVFRTPVDFGQVEVSTKALDLSHVMARVETRIAAAIGIPAVLVGLSAGLDATSYGANTKSLIETFIEGVLMSAWGVDGERWTLGLRRDFGLAPDMWIGYDWTGLRALQDDEDAKWRRWLMAWNANAVTIGQLHEALDEELPQGVDENLRMADLQAGAPSDEDLPTILDGGTAPPPALPAPGADGSGMSAARLQVLQRVAEGVASGRMSEAAAVQQIVFGFGVDEATARRLVGAAVEVVEEGGSVEKAMRPFGQKAITGDGEEPREADIDDAADDALADWAEWLEGSEDAEFGDLLDTEPVDTGRKARVLRTKAPRGRWRWDPDKQRYRYGSGRAVDAKRVAGLRERRVEESRVRMRGMTERMVNGDMSRSAWLKAMREESARAHTELRMLAVGGRGNMTREDWQWVHDRMKRERDYLAGFSRAIPGLSDAQILARAEKYAGSSMRDAYYSGATASHIAAGYTRKRRVGPHDERSCDKCDKEIRQGWVPIERDGWVIGDTDCQSQDRCDIEFDRR